MLSLNARAGRSKSQILRFLVGLVVVAAAFGPTTASAMVLEGPHDRPSTQAVEPMEFGFAVVMQPMVAAVASVAQPVAIASRAGEGVFVGPPPLPRSESTRVDQTEPAAPSPSSVGAVALSSIPYAWQTKLPGWTITFVADAGARRGSTNASARTITIAVGPQDSTASVARVVAHELGHAADLTFNDTAGRRAWKQTRGIADPVAWWPASTGDDFSTGSGDFAECFATWQVGSTSRSTFGRCSAADITAVAAVGVSGGRG